jgi:hypothetical protein
MEVRPGWVGFADTKEKRLFVAPEARDIFLGRNRIASLLAVLTFPLYVIAALLTLLPVVLPAGQVLGIDAIALFAVWRAPAALGRIRLPSLIWLSVSSVAILVLGLPHAGWRDLLREFSPIFCLTVFPVLALESLLKEHAMAWRKSLSVVMSASCLCVGAIMAWAILDDAVKYLPDV